ncbi:diguanylate cyclase [Photobacterium kagoshimensis]|uniref:GGDEF domain-containing protein n=1 Tax=Photobacterium kagoshimensis TaxID=2910242 RepID=UPI003D13A1AC
MLTSKLLKGIPHNHDDIHALLTNDSGGFIQAILDCIPMPVFYRCIKGLYLGCNDAFSEAIGLSKEEIIGNTLFHVFPKEQAEIYLANDAQLLKAPGRSVFESEMHTFDKRKFYVRFHKVTFNDKTGSVAGFLGMFEDLTDQKKMENELHRLATRDHLTQIYNRRAIETKLKNEIAIALKYYRTLSVVMLDLDGFKKLNDGHGHQLGDRLLQRVASELLVQRRACDYIGRFGGDEFLIIMPHTSLESAKDYTGQLQRTLQALCFDAFPAEVGVSLGIGSLKPDDMVGKNASQVLDELIAQADSAMYRDKKIGRTTILA